MRFTENHHMVPRSAVIGLALWCLGFALLMLFVLCTVGHLLVAAL